MKYNQELPENVESALDSYMKRIKDIKWFQPSDTIKREDVDVAVKAAISAFGVEASIEYRQLKTSEDWGAAWDAAWGAARDAAWGAARDAAWDAAWGAAWGAVDVLASFTDTYKGNTPFLKLVNLYEMGLYPIGLVDGKFVVCVPPSKMEFPEELN